MSRISSRNHLFFEPDLDSQLRNCANQVSSFVQKIPEDQFLISKDGDIVENIVPQLEVKPLELQLDAITTDQNETQVDVSGDPMRDFRLDDYGPFLMPGTLVEVDIPYTGDEWIFRYSTNPFTTVFPQADIIQGKIRISISLPHDVEKERFKEMYDEELRLIRDCVERSTKQVSAFNQNLPELIRQTVASRRERLARHENIAKLLDIPVTAKKNAPQVSPIPIAVHSPKPLPVPPKSGLRPEPGIKDETYEEILHFIRHQGRTFERTPGTFAVHDEEGLRDIILAQLNGQFEGKAAGEVFREKGKTDICIEQDDRAAFVGECKLWKGSGSVTKALNQLMGYLTWRDSKAALIVFNSKNKNFSKIVEELPGTLNYHSLFVSDLPCNERGEWRVVMRSAEDEGRRVTVHVFVFDLYKR